MTTQPQSKYELFHTWLSNCPVKMINLQDKYDTITITFENPPEEQLVSNVPVLNAPPVRKLS